jgi:hypothetical protein
MAETPASDSIASSSLPMLQPLAEKQLMIDS